MEFNDCLAEATVDLCNLPQYVNEANGRSAGAHSNLLLQAFRRFEGKAASRSRRLLKAPLPGGGDTGAKAAAQGFEEELLVSLFPPKEGSKLQLLKDSPRSLRQMLLGKRRHELHSVSASGTTLATLKALVEAMIQVPAARQRLVWCGEAFPAGTACLCERGARGQPMQPAPGALLAHADGGGDDTTLEAHFQRHGSLDLQQRPPGELVNLRVQTPSGLNALWRLSPLGCGSDVLVQLGFADQQPGDAGARTNGGSPRRSRGKKGKGGGGAYSSLPSAASAGGGGADDDSSDVVGHLKALVSDAFPTLANDDPPNSGWHKFPHADPGRSDEPDLGELNYRYATAAAAL